MRAQLFHKNDTVLLLGEGNFSFAVALIKLAPCLNLTATCYESAIAFRSGIQNVDYLQSQGARVLLGVDATKLSEYFSLDSPSFDVVVFNFPHVGGKMKIHLNRELLRDFFISAEGVLNNTGTILVTLCNGQGGTPADSPQRRWDDSWQIVEMAAHGNFLLTDVEPFSFDECSDYSCVGYRSLDKGFFNRNSLVHIFKKSEKPDFCNIGLITMNCKKIPKFNGVLGWKELMTTFSEKSHIGKLNSSSKYPLRYSFDITFAIDSDFDEFNFYMTLFNFAGNVIDDVEFLGSYRFHCSPKITRTYKISYSSSQLPLFRKRVIDIHKTLVSKILEDRLNVVVSK